ncbi:MAG: hypothetical protein ACK4MF_11525 [Hyphomicrobiaceae bacterium]
MVDTDRRRVLLAIVERGADGVIAVSELVALCRYPLKSVTGERL